MPAAPPPELHGRAVTLRRYRLSDRDALGEAIAASHDHLRRWMPWAQAAPTEESVLAFLGPAVADFGARGAAEYAITLAESGRYVGGCGLMAQLGAGALEIGYWLDVRFLGRGLATEAAALLTDTALSLDGIDRVEIHCDEANVRSAGVPRRLGYRLDRIDDDEVITPGEVGRSMIWVAAPPSATPSAR
ncbi:MAG TPA: GNAT family N-acetyltransferase [Acidimicrobiia bacterium]|nr:GNAT family N-acetyltransferase [Acidimicrobiia bacterium]